MPTEKYKRTPEHRRKISENSKGKSRGKGRLSPRKGKTQEEIVGKEKL